MLDDWIVYAAVACASVYTTWRLMPGSLRFALAEQAVTLAQRLGLAKPDAEATRRRAEALTRGACGGCTGCAGKKAAQQQQQQQQQIVFIHGKDS